MEPGRDRPGDGSRNSRAVSCKDSGFCERLRSVTGRKGSRGSSCRLIVALTCVRATPGWIMNTGPLAVIG